MKLLFGQCLLCNRKKSMTVIDDTIQAEGFGDFFRILHKKVFNASGKNGKKWFEKSEMLWKSEQTLVMHLHLEVQKQVHQVYLK